MNARAAAVALVLVGISVAFVGAQAQQQPVPAPIQSGFGQGAYRPGPGSGVADPQLLRETRPNYTSAGLRAKIQGVVELEVVVLANGIVGDVRVTKSLDTTFGLDAEAVIAAKKWLFKPGSVNGVAVPTLVTLILEFRLSRNPPPSDAPPAGAVSQQTLADDEFLKGVTREGDAGAVAPRLISQPRPNYTSEAMRRKVQGVVEIEAVVLPDGSVARARVVESVDKYYGLDEEALAAAKKTRFAPDSGTLNGTPVPCLVRLKMEFRLH